MPLTFPSSPTLGQQVTQNGRTYQWSGYAWELVISTGTGTAITDASLITTGTLAVARLPIGTGITTAGGNINVGYGTTSTTACIGNDSRLSDARTPTSHTHGQITNAGAIGTTANLPVITTTSGVLTTGTFGTTANSFCQGNDSRLSDTRTPTDNTVTTAKLVDANVTTAKLADNSVTTAKILDANVTTAKVANSAVTYAKIQNTSVTDVLLGRATAGAGVVEEVACTAAGRALIAGASAAAQRTTLGLGTMATQASTAYLPTTGGTLTGSVVVPAGSTSAPGVGIAGDTTTGIAQIGGAGYLGLVAGGTQCMRVTSGGAITTVVEGLGANLYPGYMCRAWVNFNGAATANITGTYSQSLTTVTITTSVAHGQLVGDRVYLDFTSGTGTDQGATVASVVSSTVFTATLTTSATTSGSVTVSRNAVRGGGNVSSVADLGTGNYAINMYVPAPHTNYAVTTGITLNGGNSFSTSAYVDSMSQEWFLIGTSTDNTRLLFDPSIVCVAVFY